MIEVSAHAYERARERLSFKPKTIDRMAETAWAIGSTRDEATGGLRAYIDRQAKKYTGDQYFRIHGEYLYIFSVCLSDITLITVYKIPDEYTKLIPRGK